MCCGKEGWVRLGAAAIHPFIHSFLHLSTPSLHSWTGELGLQISCSQFSSLSSSSSSCVAFGISFSLPQASNRSPTCKMKTSLMDLIVFAELWLAVKMTINVFSANCYTI